MGSGGGVGGRGRGVGGGAGTSLCAAAICGQEEERVLQVKQLLVSGLWGRSVSEGQETQRGAMGLPGMGKYRQRKGTSKAPPLPQLLLRVQAHQQDF